MSLNNRELRLILLFVFLFLSACSHQSSRPDPDEEIMLQNAMKNLSSEYSNPRLVTGVLRVSIEDISLLSGENLEASNLARGVPADQSPSLHIWSSDIRDYPTQKVLQGSSIQPHPTDLSIDSEHGNQILYWNPALNSDGDITLTRNFRYITYDYKPEVDRDMEHLNWDQIPDSIFGQYTRPETFLEQDSALIDTVSYLVVHISDPVSQAEALYNWVQKSLTYVYPPDQRGVQNAFETRKGDCGQYSALFMTMCRIAGIPARQQSGFNFVSENTGAHVWSEIYLPIKGWVPVDATRKNGFLHLDNQRLITSIGLNIPLKFSPGWATYENSEVEGGQTDFMQMYTLVSSGIDANYSSTLQVIRSVELP
ncbi:MAG: transglutaminase domain-containing protein [Candidatus Marinimicrobia bacterium]|nr:transglutaminase domain-containing protein [Candidatus Neomarinimicrobiota bacterium]